MKPFCYCLIITLFLAPGSSLAIDDHTEFTRLLASYVSEGKVSYARLKKDEKKLDHYLDSLAKIKASNFSYYSIDQQVTFLINAYNAYTLKTILENYPKIKKGWFKKGRKLTSIKNISDPWGAKKHMLLGEKVSLDYIEHKQLRKNYSAPLLHFALVCAAKSCPYLRNEAYEADDLHSQLNEQTAQFFSLPENMLWDADTKTLSVSSILKWYGEDFISDYYNKDTLPRLSEKDNAIVNLVKKYVPDKELASKLFNVQRVDFLPYDWSLNSDE